MDDIIQGSGEPADSWDTAIIKHAKDLRRMFGRARVRGFRFSIEKCSIAKKFIQYLGHMLGQGKLFSTEKTRVNMQKLIDKARIDQSDKEFERLYGFFQYSAKFLANFSKFRKEINVARKHLSALKLDKTKEGKIKLDSEVEIAQVVGLGAALRMRHGVA